jgi:hypothetical protein
VHGDEGLFVEGIGALASIAAVLGLIARRRRRR